MNAVADLLEARLRGAPKDAQADAQAALRAGLDEINALWKELLARADYLALESQRYAAFFEYAPDAYVVTDPAGIVCAANPLAAELLQVRRGALYRRALSSFIAYDERPDFRARLAVLAMSEDGVPRIWNTAVRRRGGAACAVRLSVRSIRGAGGSPSGFCWLLRPAG